MKEAVLLMGSYLIGAIPFGYLIARAHGVNIFAAGSGNIGATNINRVLGTGPALAVFLLDVSKGIVPALIARQLMGSQEWALGAGLTSIAGHCLSPFLRFKGGKGIATGLGAVLGSSPLVAVSALGVFIVSMLVSRYVSVSALLAVIFVVLFGWLFKDPPVMIGFYGLLAVLVFFKHRGNIKRLLSTTEPKFHFGKDKPKEEKGDADAEESKDEMSYAPYKPYGAPIATKKRGTHA